MQALDYGLIGFYLVLPLLVGPWLARQVKSSADLFAAGNQSPWWLSGMSGYMTMFSSGTFVVWGGIAFKYGMAAVSICMSLGVSALIVAALLARKWRNSGANSAAEFIYYRFGPGVVQMYTWLILAARIAGVAVSIYSFAVIACELMPVSADSIWANEQGRVSTEAAIVVAGLAIIGYTVFGGLWSVLVTDMMQFVVLTSSVAIVAPLMLAEAGGLSKFRTQAPDGFFLPTASDYTWWFLAGWVVIHAMKIGGEWAFVQRLTCVPSAKDAVKSSVLFGVLYLVTPLFWMAPAMIYRVIEPIPETLTPALVSYFPEMEVGKLAEADRTALQEGALGALSPAGSEAIMARAIDRKAEAAYIRACREVAPAGLLGMMLASMFAATASMANSELNVMAGAITNDIYAPLLRTPASDRHLVLVGRILTVLIGGLLIGVTLAVPRMGGAEKVILTITGLFVGPMVLPTIWGLFSSRIGWRAAVLTVLLSAAAAASLKYGMHDVAWVNANARVAEIAVGTIVPVIILLICELAARGVDPGAVKAAERKSLAATKNVPTTHDLPLKVMAISLGTQATVFFGMAAASGEQQLLLTGGGAICSLLTLWVLGLIRQAGRRRVGP